MVWRTFSFPKTMPSASIEFLTVSFAQSMNSGRLDSVTVPSDKNAVYPYSFAYSSEFSSNLAVTPQSA